MTLEIETASLSEARLARGLTLEDAERGTRISRRFLIALENHDYSVFPAPVYARGFLRTYCRYLGVNPEQQLAELPEGWAAPAAAAPLPPVSHGPINLNVSWLIAGALVVAVIGLGLYLSRSSDDLGDLQAQQELQVQQQAQGATLPADNVEPGRQTTSDDRPATSTGSTAPRGLQGAIPGVLPDFAGVAVADAVDYLEEQGIAYLRIDTETTSAAKGLVIAQAPRAGVATAGLGQVTLTVSADLGAAQARTDCNVLRASNHRTAAEQAYFEANCSSSPPAQTADRTNCEEIRGTDYRSPAERAFFLANCIIQ